MKVGDIFYFVDNSLGKITKHKIIELIPPCTQGKSESITFSDLKYKAHPSNIRLNPIPENYFTSFTKFYGTNKCYLVFTEIEDAQKALINFILPQLVAEEQAIADDLIETYQKIIERVSKLENEIKINTENFDKKCNALKAKFV